MTSQMCSKAKKNKNIIQWRQVWESENMVQTMQKFEVKGCSTRDIKPAIPYSHFGVFIESKAETR